MNTMNLRLIGCGALCLTIGVVAGYWLGTTHAVAGDSPKSPPAMMPATTAGSVHAESLTVAGPDGSLERRETPADPERAKVIGRLEALRWFKSNVQAWFNVGVFSSPDRGELDANFVSAYGLTEEDSRLLREALAAARERLDRGRIAAAKVEVRPDNLGAVIEVPALPELGGAAYDEVLATFRRVLEPDRWEYFKAMSANAFEQGFHEFGAEQNKIEIEVKQSPGGGEYFSVKDHVVGTDRSGWSEIMVDPGMFGKSYPFASKLLPESFLRAQPKQ